MQQYIKSRLKKLFPVTKHYFQEIISFHKKLLFPI